MGNDHPQFRLDTASGVPIYRQIVDWVRVQVAGGGLQPGDQLPTARQMAVDLNVNYNTVARSYTELERMGVVNTLQGKGTFIAPQEITLDTVVRTNKLRELVTEFLSKTSEFGFGAEEVLAELSLRIPPRESREES